MNLMLTDLDLGFSNKLYDIELKKLPDNFSHTKFLEFLFLTVEHYNQFWYKKLQQEKA